MSRERPRRFNLPPAQENIDKLEKTINEGNYYGAQQMYKSISARYAAAQRFSEALDILHSGSCLQLKNNQITCAAELAVLFVETLVKGKVPYEDSSLDRVREIYKLFPQIPVPHDLGPDDDEQKLAEALGTAKLRVEGCSSFLKAAIKWSAEFGADNQGAAELHSMLADYMYSESPELDMARLSYHFVRGEDVKKFASTLVNFMGKCYPGEDDLAIARAVLMYLSMGNLRDANEIVDDVKEQLEAKHLEFPQSEMIHFISFLLQTIERDAFPLYNMLRINYKPCIDREPVFNEYLDDIAEKFFGVQRRSPFQGMFGEIFRMMG